MRIPTTLTTSSSTAHTEIPAVTPVDMPLSRNVLFVLLPPLSWLLPASPVSPVSLVLGAGFTSREESVARIGIVVVVVFTSNADAAVNFMAAVDVVAAVEDKDAVARLVVVVAVAVVVVVVDDVVVVVVVVVVVEEVVTFVVVVVGVDVDVHGVCCSSSVLTGL